MSDEYHICDGCGEQFGSPQGLGGHQRYCDEYQELDEGGDTLVSGEADAESRPATEDTSAVSADATTVSTAVSEDVMERDSHECRNCGSSEEPLVVHKYKPDGRNVAANLVTLCGECHEEIKDFHYRTKRTYIKRDR